MFAESEEEEKKVAVEECGGLERLGAGSELPAQYPAPHPSLHHTVAVRLPVEISGPRPHPTSLTDRWDGDHVRLPWSRENLYPVEAGERGGRKVLRSRWDLIQESLTQPSVGSSQELEAAILRYNTRYTRNPDWSFAALHKLFSEEFSSQDTESFFDTILPRMIDLLVSSPDILTCPLPLLSTGKTQSITLSQQQISVLLVNAFFCTFPRRNARSNNAEFSSFPFINFNTLFGLNHRRDEAHMEKLKCLLSYFSRVVTNTPTGLVTFTRKCLEAGSLPDWESSQERLSRVNLTATGLIETEGAGMLQVDFANKFVGGGVLSSGLVQEEIRFTVCPELIASMLFTEVLADNEVLFVIGAEQYSSYTGYADNFTFSGRFHDTISLDSAGRRETSIVAMDAIRFTRSSVQYNKGNVDRELTKSFVAFSSDHTARLAAVATGNWGCGAFNGDCRLKFLIQLLAASVANRAMAYFTFGDEDLVREGGEIQQFLVTNDVRVGQLYSLVIQFGQSGRQLSGQELFRWIYQNIRKEKVDLGIAGAYDADTDEEVEQTQAGPDIQREVEGGDQDDLSHIQSVNKEAIKEDIKMENDQNNKLKNGGFFATVDRMERGELQSRPESFLQDRKVKAQTKMTDFFK